MRLLTLNIKSIVMRCHNCNFHFTLPQSIAESTPPGPSASPKQVLVVVLGFGVLTGIFFNVSSFLGWLLLILTVCSFFSWIRGYIGWLLDRNPYTNQPAGTCPECGTRNTIFPWSH